jgi:TolB-like protein/tetratricopeptide (TPR) repeat protein
LSQLFQELKRRNVFRVAIAYLAVAWVIMQAADIVFDNVAAPEWLMPVVLFFIVVGFPVALLFAWAYEMTPEGIKRERDVDRTVSITGKTGRKLDGIIIGVLGVAVIFLLVDRFALEKAPPEAEVTDKSVAVLPFVAMSSGPDDEYFADGLTEEILNSLTRVPELLVTARTSAFHFKGEDIPPIPEIAAMLGVAHIVEGSVRRDGQRLRVTAQLIRAVDGFHLWSENYDHNTEDTFGVQSDIAEKIATALDVVLDDEQLDRMHAVGLRDPEAFVAYQKGVELFDLAHGSPTMLDDLLRANEWLDKALALAPDLSDAYLRHSDYFTHFLMDTVTNQEVSEAERSAAFEQLEQDLENAIRTAPGESQRLSATFDLAFVTGRWRGMPALFDKIVAQPACVRPNWLHMTTVAYGRARENLIVQERSINCDPISFGGWAGASGANRYLGNYDAAIDMASKGLEMTPHIRLTQQLILAYLAAGRFDDAELVINRDIRRSDRLLTQQFALAAARGDAATTELLLDEIAAASLENRQDLIVEFANSGNRDKANQQAAEMDSRPHGHLSLMIISTICNCGAPFDLEATPNFARLIAEANLPWPPDSPIDWPLKDW